MEGDSEQPYSEAQADAPPPPVEATAAEPLPDNVIVHEAPAPAAPEAPVAEAAPAFTPGAVLAEALGRGVADLAGEAAAQPLRVVLGRAHGELRGAGLSDETRRLLQMALSAAGHNQQLSSRARTALAAVAVALRGLN